MKRELSPSNFSVLLKNLSPTLTESGIIEKVNTMYTPPEIDGSPIEGGVVVSVNICYDLGDI